MRTLLWKWAVLTVAILLSAVFLRQFGVKIDADSSSFGSVVQLFFGAAVLAVVNGTLGRILKLLTLPLNCMTLGLMSLVINAVMLQLVGTLGYGIKVGDFFAAFIGSIVISIVNAVLGSVIPPPKGKTED